MNDKITGALKAMKKKLAEVPNEAYKEFVKDTPVRSGNARRNTHLQKNTINADYPYAKRLNEGYSDQAPSGMVTPTLAFVKKRVAAILKGK